MDIGEPLDVELVVAGAGYAGANAVYAACSYLPKHAKIAWVEPRLRIGGQWVDQYEYVTLHQPHETYSIGGRNWNRGWHWSHLATKSEILEYFEESIEEITEKTGVEIVRVFGYKVTGYATDAAKGIVEVQADAEDINGAAPRVFISAKRFIKATGFEVPIKHPIEFTAADQVVSTCPVDLHDPELLQKMKASSKPVIVLGSGKTALDTFNMLGKVEELKGRLQCICGHGTLFINRDKAFPTEFFARNMLGTNTFIDWLREAALKYNGSNAQEVLQFLQKVDFLHTPIDGSTGFVLGICSSNEVKTAKEALTPAEEKVTKGHLVDIFTKEGQVLMKIRSLDGKTFYDKPIPVGSFIVNCTDHLPRSVATWEPIISDDGLLLAPQWMLGFSGPTAAYCTHMFYRGLLEDVWRDMPRLELDLRNKANMGLTLGFISAVALTSIAQKLPASLALELNPAPKVFAFHKTLLLLVRIRLAGDTIMEHLKKTIPGRFTDQCSGNSDFPPVLGGNIGVKRLQGGEPTDIDTSIGARL